MIPRYTHRGIAAISADSAKLARWDKVEDAVIETRFEMGHIEPDDAAGLERIKHEPIDVAAWLEREKETGHDLAAYVELRWESLPAHLRRYFHDGMTSYDTEDPAFVLALQEASNYVHDAAVALTDILWVLAKRYRYQPMLERTHGQWAKLASLGSRFLMWRAELAEADHALIEAQGACMRSRISGAIGTYGGRLTPEVERKALEKLGLAPFYGAGQIAPRTLYLRIAHALEQMAIVLAKIAEDFELGARSGRPLWHEPFGRAQKGSSAMPHKKNPITMEQTRGLAALARGYVSAIAGTALTKERRDIAQSCVERTAWPDLFHTLMRMLSNVTRVLAGMQVYPDNMYREIDDSRGTYASEDAKTFLAEKLAERGVGAEVAYRIVQLACWNALPVAGISASDAGPESLEQAQSRLENLRPVRDREREAFGLQTILLGCHLENVPSLGAGEDDVREWNRLLYNLLSPLSDAREEFKKLFTIPYQLQGEAYLFEIFDF